MGVSRQPQPQAKAASSRASDGGRARHARPAEPPPPRCMHRDRIMGCGKSGAVCGLRRMATRKLQSIKVEGRPSATEATKKSASQREERPTTLRGALMKDEERKTQPNALKRTRKNTDANAFIRFRSRIYFPSQPSSKASRPPQSEVNPISLICRVNAPSVHITYKHTHATQTKNKPRPSNPPHLHPNLPMPPRLLHVAKLHLQLVLLRLGVRQRQLRLRQVPLWFGVCQ